MRALAPNETLCSSGPFHAIAELEMPWPGEFTRTSLSGTEFHVTNATRCRVYTMDAERTIVGGIGSLLPFTQADFDGPMAVHASHPVMVSCIRDDGRAINVHPAAEVGYQFDDDAAIVIDCFDETGNVSTGEMINATCETWTATAAGFGTYFSTPVAFMTLRFASDTQAMCVINGNDTVALSGEEGGPVYFALFDTGGTAETIVACSAPVMIEIDGAVLLHPSTPGVECLVTGIDMRSSALPCDFAYAYVQSGVSTGEGSFAATCLSGSCEMALASAGCGCARGCTETLLTTLTEGKSSKGVALPRTFKTGDSVCSTGQLAIMASNRRQSNRRTRAPMPVTSAALSGLVFAYSVPTDNADVTCTVTAHFEKVDAVAVTGEGDRAIDAFNSEVYTFPKRQTSDPVLIFVASAPVTVVCSLDRLAVGDVGPGDYHYPLLPVTTEPLYAALSSKLTAIAVDCVTGQIISAADVTCTVRTSKDGGEPCPGYSGKATGAHVWSSGSSNDNYRAMPIRVQASGGACLAATVAGDGTGAHMISAYPRTLFSTTFGVPSGLRGIAIVSDTPFRCTTLNGRVFANEVAHASGLYMKSIDSFGFKNTGTTGNAALTKEEGYVITCDVPVMAIGNTFQARRNRLGDEYNIQGVEDLWSVDPVCRAGASTDSPTASKKTTGSPTASADAASTDSPTASKKTTANPTASTDSPTASKKTTPNPTASNVATTERPTALEKTTTASPTAPKKTNPAPTAPGEPEVPPEEESGLGGGAIAGIVLGTLLPLGGGVAAWMTRARWLPILEGYRRAKTSMNAFGGGSI